MTKSNKQTKQASATRELSLEQAEQASGGSLSLSTARYASQLTISSGTSLTGAPAVGGVRPRPGGGFP